MCGWLRSVNRSLGKQAAVTEESANSVPRVNGARDDCTECQPGARPREHLT